MLFGLASAEGGIHYQLVDSNGMAEGALGSLVTTDVVQSRAPCTAIRRNCERKVRITAKPDLSQVEMQIDLAIEQAPAVSFTIVMHRVPGSSVTVLGRAPE